MNEKFQNDFADFLEEQLSSALFALRESNAEYKELSDKYAELLNSRHFDGGTAERLSEIGEKAGDILKRYLFIAGMRERTMIDHALFSEDFENIFIK